METIELGANQRLLEVPKDKKLPFKKKRKTNFSCLGHEFIQPKAETYSTC